LTVVHFIQSKSVISDEQLFHYTRPTTLFNRKQCTATTRNSAENSKRSSATEI